jgi:hypothetical protein
MKKYLFFGILMALPSVVAKVYVELSFYIFIMKSRNVEFSESDIDIQPLKKLLNVSFNEDSVTLPLKTYDWIWGKAGEEHLVEVNGRKISVVEMLRDAEKTKHYNHDLVTYFVNRLPKNVLAKLCKGPDKSHVRNLSSVKQDFARLLSQC